jgi:simple sugar transport system ATP-binding protein
MVFQHFSSFEALSVAENIALAMPGLSLSNVRSRIRDISKRYGLAVDPSRRVERLSAGEKQRVEIVRALLQKPKLLILDEPTSVLTPQEADGLFDTLNTLANDGMSLIYISHRLSEIQALCDTATIMRQGEVVGARDPKTTSVSELAELMIGKTAAPIRRVEAYVGGVRLNVDKLTMPVKEGVPLKDVSFTARRGEVIGIAGVAGEGQDTLFSALSGERRTPYATKIRIDDKPIGSMGPAARRRMGAAFAPEQRLGHAAVADMTLSENLRLTRHNLSKAAGEGFRKLSKKIRVTYDVRAAEGDPKAGTLSGGNLQKFVMGRELERDPAVFVVAQPTWGVDAGAASVIRNELLSLTQRGAAVVVISQDLDEIFQIADRVAVLHRGTLSRTYLIDEMTPEKIGLLMAGSDPYAETAAETSEPIPIRKQSDATTAPVEVITSKATPAPVRTSTPQPATVMAAPQRKASPPPERSKAPPAPQPAQREVVQTATSAITHSATVSQSADSSRPLSPPPEPTTTYSMSSAPLARTETEPPRLRTSGVVMTRWTPRERFQSFEQKL